VESVLRDVAFGMRTLRRRPLFAMVAVGTLGLGIGVTTAIFSVVESVLLRPLPYARPGELVTVYETFPEWRDHPQLATDWDRVYLAWPDYERWRDNQTMFEDVAIYGSTAMILTGTETPERTIVGLASASLFSTLGVGPVLGRAFLPTEDGRGAEKLAILGHAVWQDRFGGDPEVIGRSIHLNDEPFVVVGVLPDGFQLRGLGVFGGTTTAPLWIPVGANNAPLREGDHSYNGIARLRSGVTLAQASPQTETLLRGYRTASEMGARLAPRVQEENAGLGGRLYLLLAAALVLLLIACGNVATLLMGELTGRRREMASRLAVGAGRGRLVRQLLTESVLLGVAGSAVGVLVAVAGTGALLRLAPPLPRVEGVETNATVLAFAVAVGVLTGIVFGLAPSLDAFRGRVGDALRGGGVGPDLRASFFQRAVISLQIALTVVLLVSGGLLVRSLDSLFSVDPGFRAEGLSEVRVQLPRYRYRDPEERLAAFRQMRRSMEAVPGVEAVVGTSSLPFSGFPNLLSFGILGEPDPQGGARHASAREVMPGFFEGMGIPLLAGRAITAADGADGSRIAVISESMAKRFWPGESALGARLHFGDTLTVVGIVGDVRHEALDAEVLPTLYVPLAQGGASTMSFVVRAGGDAESLFPSLRAAAWSVDADAPIRRTASVSSLMARSAREEHFRTVLMMVFGVSAALLAGAGVYSVTARGVNRRAQEMGIRMALGARGGSLVRTIVMADLATGLVGIVLGIAGALTASRFLSRFLFGIGGWDPPTYAAVASLALLLCMTASFIPARRASVLAPMRVLRKE
jgi:putative ABC transport system permease protein